MNYSKFQLFIISVFIMLVLVMKVDTTSSYYSTSLSGFSMGNPAELDPVVWFANNETGDLSQWRINNPFTTIESDSGACFRPPDGVTTEQAHSGQYSMKMTIDAGSEEAACKQFRKPEPVSGEPYYYSAWYYIPESVAIGTFWNVFQFKSYHGTGAAQPEAFWKLEIRSFGDGALRVVPVWKGIVPGPHEGDGIANHLYYQNIVTVPIGEWFQLEAYLEQSRDFDGHIIVWQDGVEILNEQNVRTLYPLDGLQSWSVNNYGRNINPAPNTLYIDDVIISTARIGSVSNVTQLEQERLLNCSNTWLSLLPCY